MVGTDTGMPIQYLVAMAIMIVVVGAEHMSFCGFFAVARCRAHHRYRTLGAGPYRPSATFAIVASLIAGAGATCAILFAISIYALRDTARAEAVAEREYERSETLLRNILPGPLPSA